MQKPQTSAFDSRDFPVAERLNAFREITTPVYDAYVLGSESGFMVETVGYHVSDLMFTDFKCRNTRFRRTQRHLQGNNKDFLILHAQLSGEELLQMEHGVVRFLPGNVSACPE